MLSGMGAIMKIAQVTPQFPYLTDALVAMGYDVMLFASGDGIAHAKSEEGGPNGLRRDRPMRDSMAPLARAAGRC
jgi:predicted peroxiredoxin